MKEIGWKLEDGVPVQYRDVSEEIDIQEGYMLSYNEIDIQDGINHQDDDEKDTLIVNGEETEIIDGRFKISGDPEEIEVEIDEGVTQNIKKDDDGKYRVILEQNLSELIDEVDNHEGHGDNYQLFDYYDKYSPGDWVHCNRFNGPNTDDVHYPKTHWRAYVNFYHSDCDFGALRYCKSHKNCNQKEMAAYCSYMQGHETTYHRH